MGGTDRERFRQTEIRERWEDRSTAHDNNNSWLCILNAMQVTVLMVTFKNTFGLM